MEHPTGWRRLTQFFRQHPEAVVAVVFLMAFILATWLQLNDKFADPDSFYHARMATLIRDQGNITEFPWLPYTVLADAYVDQHFLYHVLLIPFVTFASPLAGIKIAAVLLVAVLAVIFYGLLRSFKIKWALIYTLILLAVNPFMFRMGLAKAPSLAVILLLIGLWLIFTFRHRWLLFYAWLYVWVYGGFILLAVAAGATAVAGVVRFWVDRRRTRRFPLARWLEQIEPKPKLRSVTWLYTRGFLVVLLGLILGLVLNPAFPHNVTFYEYQLVKIGIINYQSSIGVGGEWYPYPVGELVRSTVFVSILILVGLSAMAFAVRRMSVRTWALSLLTVFFFVFTLKSRRYVEYYVPMGILFSAFAITDALASRAIKILRADIAAFIRRGLVPKLIAAGLVVYLLVGVGAVAIRDSRNVRRDLANGLPANTLAGAAGWLKANGRPNAIVVHSDWDDFPALFYYDPTHRYIAGLDPTFLYDRDPERYWAWVKITTGEAAAKSVPKTLRDDLRASYVVVTKDHPAMAALLAQTAGVKRAYEDGEAIIYEVTEK